MIEYTEAQANKTTVFVLDCSDAAKTDEGDPKISLNNTILKDCSEELEHGLPMALFLQPPVLNTDTAKERFYGHIKMDFKYDYTPETLAQRLDELMPSFRAVISEDKEWKDVMDVAKQVNSFVYFNDKDETSIDFKILSQEFKGKLFMAEVFANTTLKNEFESRFDRPFGLIIEKDSTPRPHPKLSSAEDLRKIISSLATDNKLAQRIMYNKLNIYPNHEEIRALEVEASKVQANFLNLTSFADILKEERSMQLIHLFNEESEIESRIYELMARTRYPITSYFLNKKYLPEVYASESEEIKKTMQSNTTNFLFIPFGDSVRKLDISLLFDTFNTTVMINGVMSHWIKDGDFGRTPADKFQNRLIKTFGEEKQQVVLLVNNQTELSFEYMISASNPEFSDQLNFGFEIDPSKDFLRGLGVEKKELPILVTIGYSQENYKSPERFAIKRFREQRPSGYSDYIQLEQYFYQEVNGYKALKKTFSESMGPLHISNIEDLEIEQGVKRVFFVTLDVRPSI